MLVGGSAVEHPAVVRVLDLVSIIGFISSVSYSQSVFRIKAVPTERFHERERAHKRVVSHDHFHGNNEERQSTWNGTKGNAIGSAEMAFILYIELQALSLLFRRKILTSSIS